MSTITNQTIAERASYDIGVEAQDVGTADVTGPWYSMLGFHRVAVIATSDEVTADDTLTIQLRQAEDDEGTNADDVGDPVTVTAGGAEAIQAFVEAKASEFDADKPYVAAQVGSSADGTIAAAVVIRADGSYRP